MKKIFFFLVVMMAVNGVMAQAPNIQWAKCYGGSGEDEVTSVYPIANGGYILAGYSNSTGGDVTNNHGLSDFWIVKIDASGNIQWQKSLGGSGTEMAYSIQQTYDSGFIVIGMSDSNDGDVTGNHGSYDVWVVKLSNIGVIEWQKSLGGSGIDLGYAIQQTTDSGYIIAAETNSNDSNVTGLHGDYDFWVVKLSLTGSIQWKKTLGGSSLDQPFSVKQTTDGGYVVAGLTQSDDGDVISFHTGFFVSADYWVIKLSSTGALQWQSCLGSDETEYALSIQQTIDGGYIVAGGNSYDGGDVSGTHGGGDAWVVKLSDIGLIEWQKCLGGQHGEWARSIQQSAIDGSYIVACTAYSNNGEVTGHHGSTDSSDFWIVKLSNTGSILWQKSLGGIGIESANSIQYASDSGYIVAGWCEMNNGDVTGFHGGFSDFWVVKLSKDLTSIEETPTSSISLSPNPTTGIITIKGITQPTVAVYNLMGQKVVAAEGSNEVNLAHLPAGMYMVQVFNKDMELVKSEKVILNR